MICPREEEMLSHAREGSWRLQGLKWFQTLKPKGFTDGWPPFLIAATDFLRPDTDSSTCHIRLPADVPGR